MASILSYFLLAQTCFNLPVVKVSDPDKENRPNCQGLLAKIASNGLDKNVLFFSFSSSPKIKAVGCDLIVGSKQKVDSCGICGGRDQCSDSGPTGLGTVIQINNPVWKFNYLRAFSILLLLANLAPLENEKRWLGIQNFVLK